MGARTSVDGLRLKFAGSPSLLFNELSLAIEPGQKVLLLGPSGCGKSTLLQVLSGLIPSAIDVPVRYDRIEVPSSWGYVFQDPDTQFCMPYADEELAFVLENLGVPREQMLPKIRSAIAEVGLSLPELHYPIASMSQGMKQRLAIASVLALEPEVLFLDEPTALLDPEGTCEVWETIKAVSSDKTILIVEHKIDEVIDFVDRVILFQHDGRILADGAPRQVFSQYKSELQTYGIWYPGVWKDYVEGPVYSMLQGGLELRAARPVNPPGEQTDLLKLRQMTGYQGREPKIFVESAKVNPGDWIAVVGENGAGKSTLLQSMMQLIPTSGGSYELQGRNVRSFKDVIAAAAYVFQNPEMQFVTNSVFDELAFGFRKDRLSEAETKRHVGELLRDFALEEQRDQHPYQLSLGQKRRLSVATAMTRNQQLILLDEPTFGQDAANTFAILERLEQWRRKGTAIIMVTHDLEIVRYFATRVWVVEGGRLLADTRPEAYLRASEADSVISSSMERAPMVH
ncbi:ABC transporter ATP-binding protein [Paenibacillus rigui]|uniref:ABC transporter n=1 Tax=Paenibacillus rigui TaxID=554312 RepID=A0A229UWN6_9BACL|nr:ABC transporter ATP-binding protein [Paenibacillus rigui]OXM87319.1 ABC transporter [Paenibacillus rigui]